MSTRGTPRMGTNGAVRLTIRRDFLAGTPSACALGRLGAYHKAEPEPARANAGPRRSYLIAQCRSTIYTKPQRACFGELRRRCRKPQLLVHKPRPARERPSVALEPGRAAASGYGRTRTPISRNRRGRQRRPPTPRGCAGGPNSEKRQLEEWTNILATNLG